LQAKQSPLLAVVVVFSVVLVCGLHVAAARQTAREDAAVAAVSADPPWVVAGPVAALADGAGMVIHLPDAEAVAIFRHDGRLSAVSNLCAHQNGPLGEGRVVDGCITCPWHGFQYRLADGCAPAPFTEKLATYQVRVRAGMIELDPRPNPPGTFVEPAVIA
jgi:nitrite reductase/ring-hydroxylating ferredoxin subunit